MHHQQYYRSLTMVVRGGVCQQRIKNTPHIIQPKTRNLNVLHRNAFIKKAQEISLRVEEMQSKREAGMVGQNSKVSCLR